MNNDYGCQSMVGEIKRVLVKHPKDAYQNQLKIDGESKKLNYIGKPDYKKSITDYEQLIDFFNTNNFKFSFF